MDGQLLTPDFRLLGYSFSFVPAELGLNTNDLPLLRCSSYERFVLFFHLRAGFCCRLLSDWNETRRRGELVIQ